MKRPSDFPKPTSHDIDSSSGFWLYMVYQKYISPIDGDRCPMQPSCSHYAQFAITRYGIFKGFLLITDRLTRCGNDLWRYPQFVDHGREYFVDYP